MILVIIVIFIMVLLLVYIKKTNTENMTVVGEGKQIDSNAHTEIGKITFNSSFNGRMAIDDQYFYNKIFDNVAYFDNKYDYDSGDLITTGWETCKMQCTGNCVEYGLSGATYCFPY